MARMKQDLTLKHRANLGEEAEDVQFEADQEVTVLREWEDRVLCKNEAGQLFNIPKHEVEL